MPTPRLRLVFVALVLLCSLLRAGSAQSVTLAIDAASATRFQVVHLTATLSGGAPTGTITFLDNGAKIASVPVSAVGTAVLSDAALTPGTHAITAVWSGGGGSSSAPVALTITGLPGTFTVYADPVKLYQGQTAYLSPQGSASNATGSYLVTDAGGTLATLPIAGTSTARYDAYGDSITAGYKLADLASGYNFQFADRLGFSSVDRGIPGALSCDIMTMEVLPKAIGPSQVNSPLSSLLIGTNDIDFWGQSADYSGVFQPCHQAALAWLGTPREYKILSGDPGLLVNGPWTHSATWDSTYSTLYETVGSGALTFSLTTSGAPIYLWHLMGDHLEGTFLVKIDGVPTGAIYSSTPAHFIGSLINPADSTGFALDRFPVLPGAHTVDVVVQSGTVGILAVGTPPSPGAASVHPTVLVGDVPSEQVSNPAYPLSYLPLYNSYIQQDIALLQADGLDLRYVPTEQFLLGQDDEYIDQVHPNALGHTHLAAAFESVFGSSSLAPYTTFTNSEPSTYVPFTTVGTYTLQMAYSGDQTYAPATASLDITVMPKNGSTTSLTAPGSSFTATTPILLQASVTPATASGVVGFWDGTNYLGSGTLATGAASLTTGNLLPGTHNLVATYSGDPADLSSGSPVLTIQVALDPTNLTLAPIVATMLYGTPVTLTTSVTPADSTGTISLTDGFTPSGQSAMQTLSLGSALLNQGTATFTPPALAPGTHVFTAAYSGDTLHAASTSASVATSVQPVPTTTMLAAIAPIAYGTVSSVTASVTPADATGTITFRDALTGTATSVPLANGQATATPSLHAGTHPFTAAYSGDSTHAASASAVQTAVVSQAQSATTLTFSAVSVASGSPLTLTASMVPATATGTIIFQDATHGTLGQASLAQGKATLTLPTLDPGTYSLTAVYSGDADTATSTSADSALQVTLASTTTSLAQPPANVPYASPLSLTATVSPAPGAGTITFSDSGKTLGLVLVTNGSASFSTSALSPGPHTLQAVFSGDPTHAASQGTVTTTITADSTVTTLTLAQASVPAGGAAILNVRVASPYTSTPTGTVTIRSGATVLGSAQLANANAGSAYATVSVAASALGTFPVVAYYAGDTDDAPSDSSATALAFTVIPTPTAGTLTLSAAQVPPQTPVLLTAAFTASGQVPAGTVTFLLGSTALATATLDSTGRATATLTAQTIGASAVSAVYNPAGLFATSTAPPQTLTVTAPLTAVLTPATLSLAPGSNGTATLLLTPLSGFQGALATQCTAPAAIASCTIHAPVALGRAPASATLNVIVASNTAAAVPSARRFAGYATALALLLPMLFRRRTRRLGSLMTLLIGLAALSGCGEGGSFGTVAAGAQTVQITITAAGITIPVTLTVNVQ